MINFTTAAPTKDLAAGFTVGTGNYNRVRANAYVSGPIGDKVRVRVHAWLGSVPDLETLIADGVVQPLDPGEIERVKSTLAQVAEPSIPNYFFLGAHAGVPRH